MSSPKNRGTRARAAADHRTTAQSPARRSLVPIIGVAVVAVIAIAVALLVAGGDSDDGGNGGGQNLATASVTVRGEALPEMAGGGGEDPAVGMPAPRLEGVDPSGTSVYVDFDTGEPTLLAFLAHWCPHCQAELPNLVRLDQQGELDDLRPVLVATGTDEAAPNYPPGPWIDGEGWDGEVMVDDGRYSAGGAYGLSGYPYLVLVDADGNVIARASGELGLEGLQAFIQQAG